MCSFCYQISQQRIKRRKGLVRHCGPIKEKPNRRGGVVPLRKKGKANETKGKSCHIGIKKMHKNVPFG